MENLFEEMMRMHLIFAINDFLLLLMIIEIIFIKVKWVCVCRH